MSMKQRSACQLLALPCISALTVKEVCKGVTWYTFNFRQSEDSPELYLHLVRGLPINLRKLGFKVAGQNSYRLLRFSPSTCLAHQELIGAEAGTYAELVESELPTQLCLLGDSCDVAGSWAVEYSHRADRLVRKLLKLPKVQSIYLQLRRANSKDWVLDYTVFASCRRFDHHGTNISATKLIELEQSLILSKRFITKTSGGGFFSDSKVVDFVRYQIESLATDPDPSDKSNVSSEIVRVRTLSELTEIKTKFSQIIYVEETSSFYVDTGNGIMKCFTSDELGISDGKVEGGKSFDGVKDRLKELEAKADKAIRVKSFAAMMRLRPKLGQVCYVEGPRPGYYICDGATWLRRNVTDKGRVDDANGTGS